jgi:hypothetical protein
VRPDVSLQNPSEEEDPADWSTGPSEHLPVTCRSLQLGWSYFGLRLDLVPGDTGLDARLGYLFGATGRAFLRGSDKDNAARYFALAISVFDRVQANHEVCHERPSELASAIKGIGGCLSDACRDCREHASLACPDRRP